MSEKNIPPSLPLYSEDDKSSRAESPASLRLRRIFALLTLFSSGMFFFVWYTGTDDYNLRSILQNRCLQMAIFLLLCFLCCPCLGWEPPNLFYTKFPLLKKPLHRKFLQHEIA